MTAVASPCVHLCSIDQASGLCAGCGRTLAEIGAWMRLSGDERRAIMQALPARIATATRGARRRPEGSPR
jgi:predicted Fe-S protein YdhL (DUF1289 family)